MTKTTRTSARRMYDLSVSGCSRHRGSYNAAAQNKRKRLVMGAQSYNAAVDMVDRNVAEGRGDKAAFIDPARRITYCELADGCARVGPMLARLGLPREDRVAMIMRHTVAL